MRWRTMQGGGFEYCDGERVVDSLRWDNPKFVYVDMRGDRLDARFDTARVMIEKRAAGMEIPAPAQGKLAL